MSAIINQPSLSCSLCNTLRRAVCVLGLLSAISFISTNALAQPAADEPADLNQVVLQDISRTLQSGQAQYALTRLNSFLIARPRDLRARFLRGLAQMDLGRHDDAIASFLVLIDEFPELPEPYINLATLYNAIGKPEKARQALDMALRTHPSYALANKNLRDVDDTLAAQATGKLPKGSAAKPLISARELASLNPKVLIAPSPILPAILPRSAAPTAAPAEPAASAVSAPATPTSSAAATPLSNASASTLDSDSTLPDMLSIASGEALAAVNLWSKAWAAADTAAYLGAYAPNFKAEDGRTRAAWARERREEMTALGPVKIEVLHPSVQMLTATEAKVSFEQTYRSNRTHTRLNKTLTLSKIGNKWLITREQKWPLLDKPKF